MASAQVDDDGVEVFCDESSGFAAQDLGLDGDD
jgi:hypothetical protein